MESSLSNLKSIFTKLSLANELLPFYGYADEWRQFMTQFRSGSRTLWKNNVSNWFRWLSCVRRPILIDCTDTQKFEFLKQDYRYATFKIMIMAKSFQDLTKLCEFIESIDEISLIEILKIYIAYDK